MALAAKIDKTRKDIEKKIADTGAIDAVVGTADVAVKKVRSAGADITARASSMENAKLASMAWLSTDPGYPAPTSDSPAAPWLCGAVTPLSAAG